MGGLWGWNPPAAAMALVLVEGLSTSPRTDLHEFVLCLRMIIIQTGEWGMCHHTVVLIFLIQNTILFSFLNCLPSFWVHINLRLRVDVYTALHDVDVSDAPVTGVLHVLRIPGSVPILYVI